MSTQKKTGILLLLSAILLLAALAACGGTEPAATLGQETTEVAQANRVSTGAKTAKAAAVLQDDAVPLEGTLWVLESLATREGETVAVPAGTRTTITFQDGEIAGTTGCNNYGGTYEVDGNKLTLQRGPMTMMACPEPQMSLEINYLDGLDGAASYEIVGEQLKIANEAGEVVLTFGVDQPAALAGTPWQLLSFNTGTGLLSNLTTELITANFDEADTLSGFAGCNDYRAFYQADDAAITIGPAVTTRRACAEPEDAMETETGYLAALEQAATYGIEGNELTLYDAEGTRVAIYRVAGMAAEPAEEMQVEPEAGAEPVEETAAEEGEPSIIGTYETLLPSASSPGRHVVLTVFDDGTVTLSTDYLNDEPPIVEVGTWQSNEDGSVVMTMTGQENDEPYDEPVVITFVVEDDQFVAVEVDETIYGSTDLELLRQEALGLALSTAERAFVTLDLQAGFPLDPFFVSVNGGGSLDASPLGENCTGYIHQEPVVSLDWEGETDFAEIFFYSDHDPTLVIRTPAGEYLCSDDANPLLLDPVIQIDNPANGVYEIWVGSYHPDQLLPGVLVLTTRPEVNIGTFALDNLITRQSVPEVLQTEEGRMAAQELFDSIKQRQGEILKLSPGDEALKQEITTEGEVPAFEFDIEDQVCNGYVNLIPDYVFEWSGAAEQLAIFFEGEQDATLIVMAPGQEVICVDDSAIGENVNPFLMVPQPVEGLYAVWVGRLNPEAPLTGTLTVTDLADVEPAVLEPAAPASQ